MFLVRRAFSRLDALARSSSSACSKGRLRLGSSKKQFKIPSFEKKNLSFFIRLEKVLVSPARAFLDALPGAKDNNQSHSNKSVQNICNADKNLEASKTERINILAAHRNPLVFMPRNSG